MTLQPAYETTLRHGDHAVTLRASLRAAVALNDLPGGIPSAWDDLMRQTYSGIRAVILATATDKAGALSLLASLSDKPLAQFLGRAQAACLDVLAAIVMPSQREEQGSTNGPQIPLTEFFTQLFCQATSFLHWPPSEVWQASVAEIIAALEAESDRLLMMAGEGGKKQHRMSQAERQANLEAGLDPEFDRTGLQALKARHNA